MRAGSCCEECAKVRGRSLRCETRLREDTCNEYVTSTRTRGRRRVWTQRWCGHFLAQTARMPFCLLNQLPRGHHPHHSTPNAQRAIHTATRANHHSSHGARNAQHVTHHPTRPCTPNTQRSAHRTLRNTQPPVLEHATRNTKCASCKVQNICSHSDSHVLSTSSFLTHVVRHCGADICVRMFQASRLWSPLHLL